MFLYLRDEIKIVKEKPWHFMHFSCVYILSSVDSFQSFMLLFVVVAVIALCDPFFFFLYSIFCDFLLYMICEKKKKKYEEIFEPKFVFCVPFFPPSIFLYI